MKAVTLWARPLACAIALLATLAACAPSNEDASVDPVRTAYELLDQGENAKAIWLLESHLRRSPPTIQNLDEARIVLASAYLGEAGLDVFAIHDHFKDILFGKALSDQFLGDAIPATPGAAPAPEADPTRLPGQLETPTNSAMLIARLEVTFGKIREITSFLNRFPEIKRLHWPLMDEALRLLEASGDAKDLRIYRVFIRVVYLKTLLSERVLTDPRFGTRDWLCEADTRALLKDLRWVSMMIQKSVIDLDGALRNKNALFPALQARVLGVTQAIQEMDDSGDTQLSGGVGASKLKKEIREALQCER